MEVKSITSFLRSWVFLLAVCALVSLTSCSHSQKVPDTPELMSTAQDLADTIECAERVEIHGDVLTHSPMAGVYCILDDSPVRIRVYSSSEAAARAVSLVAPARNEPSIILAGKNWLMIAPEGVTKRVKGDVLTAAQIENSELFPRNPQLDDLDFCVRWSVSQWEEWVMGVPTPQSVDDIPKELQSAKSAVDMLQRQEAARRTQYRHDLDTNVWRYESRVSKLVGVFSEACAREPEN